MNVEKEKNNCHSRVNLDDLIAKMAHAINNPLMIISGKAEVLCMENAEDERLLKGLSVISEQCKKIAKVIKELKKFSDPERYNANNHSINEIIEKSLIRMKENKKNEKIEYKFSPGADLPSIFIDESMIIEAFVNIYNNSTEAMLDGGIVHISSVKNNENVQIEIEDIGTGIDENALSKVFIPFFTMPYHMNSVAASCRYMCQEFPAVIIDFHGPSAPGRRAEFRRVSNPPACLYPERGNWE